MGVVAELEGEAGRQAGRGACAPPSVGGSRLGVVELISPGRAVRTRRRKWLVKWPLIPPTGSKHCTAPVPG